MESKVIDTKVLKACFTFLIEEVSGSARVGNKEGMPVGGKRD